MRGLVAASAPRGRWRWRRRARPETGRRRRLRITREGKYFLALTLGIGLAAINTGNNPLYLILGMLLAMIMASGILSELAIAKLRIEREVPRRLFAGSSFLMGLTLHNPRSRLATYSILAEDVADGVDLGKRCYFLKLPPKTCQRTSYRHVVHRRGLWQLEANRLATRCPFGLFEKQRLVPLPQPLVVFPAIRPISSDAADRSEGERRHQGSIGRIGEYHGIRDYRHGDDPRDIAWHTSAKLRRPVVREYEDPHGQAITVSLDLSTAHTIGASERERRFEAALSYAASLLVHFNEVGHGVALQVGEQTSVLGRGDAHLDLLLRHLALLSLDSTETAPTRSPHGPQVVRICPGELSAAELARFGPDGGEESL